VTLHLPSLAETEILDTESKEVMVTARTAAALGRRLYKTAANPPAA
jgi:hypothetical protein